MSNSSQETVVQWVDDPLRDIVDSYTKLYPDRPCTVHIVKMRGKKLGETCWAKTGRRLPRIHISPEQPFVGLMDVLTHELAHVAVGPHKGHGKRWAAAYERIYRAYFRLVRARGKVEKVKIP